MSFLLLRLFFLCAICHQGLFFDEKLDKLIQDQSKLFDEVNILRQISIVQAVEIRQLKKTIFKLNLKLNQTQDQIQEHHERKDFLSKIGSWLLNLE